MECRAEYLYKFLGSILFVFFPLEILISQGAHGLFSDYVWFAGAVANPLLVAVFVFVAVSIIRLALFVWSKVSKQNMILSFLSSGRELYDKGYSIFFWGSHRFFIYFICLFLFLISGFFHLFHGSYLDVSFLVLGIGGIFIGVFSSSKNDMSILCKPLAVGAILWASIILLFYLWDAVNTLNKLDFMREYTVIQFILSFRYPESVVSASGEGLIYPLVVGNWNKASNIFIMLSILIVFGLMNGRKDSFLYFVALTLLALVSFISFSRGGFIVSGVVGGIILFYLYKQSILDVKLAAATCLFLTPLITSFLFDDMRSAWVNFDSVAVRYEMAGSFVEDYFFLGRGTVRGEGEGGFLYSLLLGQGVGSYGEENFSYVFAGTHNLFLDIFYSWGLVSLIGVLVLFVHPFYVAFKEGVGSHKQAFGLIGLISIFILSFREFDLNYLGVSAFPAFLFGVFLGLALPHRPNSISYK